MRDAGYEMRDKGYGMRDTGYGIRDTGYGVRLDRRYFTSTAIPLLFNRCISHVAPRMCLSLPFHTIQHA